MPTVAGIMGHSVKTLQLVFKSLLSTEPWLHDPYTLPIPWRADREYHAGKEDAKPAFGYMANDGLVTPHPPIARAMAMVRKLSWKRIMRLWIGSRHQTTSPLRYT